MIFSEGPLHTDEQVLHVQLEPIYNSSERTQDIVWETCWIWWTIETNAEGESGKSVHATRHDMMIMIVIAVSKIFCTIFFTGVWQKVSSGFQVIINIISQWSLSDSKFPQISRTLLSILADLKSAVVLKVSIFPMIASSPTLFSRPLEDCPECTNYNWYHRHFHVPYFIFSLLYLFIIILLLTTFRTNTDWFPLESEWHQVSSRLWDSSKYPSRFQQCCGWNCFDSFSNLQFIKPLFLGPWELFQLLQLRLVSLSSSLFQLSSMVQVLVQSFFFFLLPFFPFNMWFTSTAKYTW